MDRFIAAVCTLFLRQVRLARSAIVLKPSTLLQLHQALITRKYRLLFSPSPGVVPVLKARRKSWSMPSGVDIRTARDTPVNPVALIWSARAAGRGGKDGKGDVRALQIRRH